ncbi:response regulator transcription factor [Gordonibacter sp. An230]|uniref:response regulator transcription factor n=1 Tax=Gordonibacter sp. An230 TaxID=1965592 RepID=UPI0013A6180E|nr:helix-turn-helix transcriptional regulator [Gordonibacter sp. An230]
MSKRTKVGANRRSRAVEAAGEAVVYSAGHARGILLALAGMALQWGFLHSVTFLETVLGAQAEVEPGSAWLVNSVCTLSVFLTTFLSSRRLAPLMEHRGVIVFATVSLAAGVALLVVGNLALRSPACNYLGNASVAFGAAPMIVMWGELYKYLNPKGEQLLVTLAAAALAVALYLVETLLPLALSATVFALLPFASLGCILHARDLLKESSNTWRARTVAKRKSPALLFVCIAVFSIPYNYLRNTAGLQDVLASATTWPAVLAVAAVALVAIALAESVAERRNVLLVPGFVLFLLSAAMLAHLLGDGGIAFAVPSFLYTGYYLFLAMVYLALGPIAAATGENPTRLFSGAMLANVAGLLSGSAMGGMERLFGPQTSALAVLGVTYALFTLGIMLLSNRSYSLFRINCLDEEEYSFEYLAPLAPFGRHEAFGDGGDSGESDEGRTRSLLQAIARQCETASERYGLSAREKEVLVELVRGRTIASIAERLVVSENTIKAHTKSVYRKIGVHTREELLQSVEEADGEIRSK